MIDEKQVATTTKLAGEVLERFSKFSADGMQHLIGRLIGQGMDKPAVKAEFERALQRLETDPGLRKCWKEGAGCQAASA